MTNGSSAVTDYLIEVTDLTSSTMALVDTNSTNTTYLVSNLNSGNSYDFNVIALNAAGQSPPSATSSSVIISAPAGPIYVQAQTSSGQATIIWLSPPNGQGKVTGFVISGNGSPVTVGTGSNSYTFTGLVNGQTYTFGVAALYGTAQSAVTLAAPVVPGTVPGQATNVAFDPTNPNFFWLPSHSGGNVVSYTISGSILASTSSGIFSVTCIPYTIPVGQLAAVFTAEQLGTLFPAGYCHFLELLALMLAAKESQTRKLLVLGC